jgi:hypothetical protein
MDETTFYKVNVYLPFSSLNLPWSMTREDGTQTPLRLDDAPCDGAEMIGFMPIFGTRKAAEQFSKGRYGIDEVTLKGTQSTPKKPAYATVAVPQPDAVPSPGDNVITVDPSAKQGRRRRR